MGDPMSPVAADAAVTTITCSRRNLGAPAQSKLSVAIAAALYGVAAVHSAPILAADAAESADISTLAEVVVTAQKRQEDLQKVPISLQVLSSEKLEQLEVAGFDDFAKFLPSVSFQSLGPGQSQLYFRGIASGGDGEHAGALPATGVYLDDIPVTTIGNTLDVHMYDIARVEALAGPQGTLYGASSLSGTLRIITNKPDPSAFSASYDVKADKFGRGNGGGEFEGYVNVPLTEHAAVRLVGYYDHDGGYINNLLSSTTYQRGAPAAGIPNDPLTVSNAPYSGQRFNPTETYGGRGALRIDLNDNWTITPQILFQSQRADGDFTFDPAKGDLNVADFKDGLNEDKWYQSALTVEGKIANFDVIYSGGWFERSVHNVVDYAEYTVAYDHYSQLPGAAGAYTRFADPAGNLIDPSQFVDNHDEYTKMSHELRITSPAEYRFGGVAGAFYQRQTDNYREAYMINDLPAYYSVDGQPNTLYLSQQTVVDRDYAVFTEMTADVTDRFKVTGGIRKFWVENTLYGFFGYNEKLSANGEILCNPPLSPSTVISGVWPCVNVDKKVVESGETHKINLTYQIDANAMLYTTYSTGFRPGGNNHVVQVGPYGADTLINLELGWKTTWFEDRFRFNGAVFDERWKSMQLGIQGAQGITSIVNVGNAAVKGVESDVSWLIGNNLTLSSSGTYVNARTTQNFCDLDLSTQEVTHDCAVPTAPAGTALPVTPKLKLNGIARYKFDVGRYHSFVQGAIVHQSSSTSNIRVAVNNEMGDLPHFTTLDFSAGTGLDNWKLEAYVQNAFDQRGELGRVAQCADPYCAENYRVYPIKPMNFGIRFGQKF
jgi:iron complex outermembrane receptor protein